LVSKQYATADQYEKKLEKVMERLNANELNYNFDRHGCWIEFRYKGNLYRFDHSVAKAKSKGIDLRYGSDAFAQLVLALEDLARMAERGIYDLQTWIAGLLFLPPPTVIPEYFKFMGFTSIPADASEVRDRYRILAKQWHPDNKESGNEAQFKQLKEASEQALKHFDNE
jgi:hypothetical protein